MKSPRLALLCLFALLLSGAAPAAFSAPAEEPAIAADARCPVCGMFVAKYPQWVTKVTLSDGRSEVFDGVKDMMAYIFSPGSYGAAAGVAVGEVRVKEYYSQKWIDGRLAVYVVGSDVYGPMGHELIPFVDRSRAESFLKDHRGKEILRYEEITEQLIDSLRQGHRMLGPGRQRH